MKKLFATFAMLALAIAVLLPSPAFAQVLFARSKNFTITQTCNAVASIRKGSAPMALKIGTTYRALGKNKPREANYIYLNINGDRKWVARECGTFDKGRDLPTLPPKEQQKPQPLKTVEKEATFLPFFDFEDNPIFLPKSGRVDVTPEPPRLDDFDLAVNNVCGSPGKAVSRQEFRTLMRSNFAVLRELRDYTEGKVYGDRAIPKTQSEYLDDLTDAWFNAHGFEHIFCGEPIPGGKIGGLHYYGRYLDLQQKGLAARLDRNKGREEAKEGLIYTIGVIIKVNGQLAISRVKGYGYTLSAKDILKFATQAFANNPTTNSRSTACMLTVRDDGRTFANVFVRRSAGIRTFFPDSTPDYRESTCFQRTANSEEEKILH